MIIRRTIPPAAVPIRAEDLFTGLAGMFQGKRLVRKLEEELKEYFGVRHVFLVSSGKAALTLILQALKTLSSREEVLLPAYTCFSVPSAVLKAGLKVSLCDIDLSTLDFDDGLLENEINQNTLCLIPGHLFGIPSNLGRLKSLCHSRGIFLVEDAAQAMGGEYEGRKIGTLGDVGFFSLGRGKNITCGSGGIIITNSDQIAGKIRKIYDQLESPNIIAALKEYFQLVLMAIFIRPSLFWLPSGLTFLKLGKTFFYKDFAIKKLSGLKAGFLKNWRDRLEESSRIRKENARYFSQQLKGKTAGKDSIPYLRWPLLAESAEERDRIFERSQREGLGISVVYPTALNEIEEIKTTLNGKSFPSAEETAARLLTLPTHHLVSGEDKRRICALFETGVPIRSRKDIEKPAGLSLRTK